MDGSRASKGVSSAGDRDHPIASQHFGRRLLKEQPSDERTGASTTGSGILTDAFQARAFTKGFGPIERVTVQDTVGAEA